MNKRNLIIAAVVATVAVGFVIYEVDTNDMIPALAKSDVPKLKSGEVAYSGNHWFDEVHAPNVVDTRTVINGIKVPPMPDPKVNNATIAGVDSDNDGVRDDMDRYIAENFGTSTKEYQIAMTNARAMQNLLVNPGPNTIADYHRAIHCQTRQTLEGLSKMEHAMLNTNERGGVYGKTLAGTSTGSGSNCPNQAEIDASYN